MLARIQKSLREKDAGFTLIELLVVMIIIGILAAIAVPVFLSQRAKARDTATKADVSSVGKEIAAYYVDGTNTLTVAATGTTYTITEGGTPGGLLTDGTLSAGTEVAASAVVDAESWCVAFTNDDGTAGNNVWSYSEEGLAQGTC